MSILCVSLVLLLETQTQIAGSSDSAQHSTFASVYVALSRCRSLSGLTFLRSFLEATFFAKSHPGLIQQMTTLETEENKSLRVDYYNLLPH